MGWYRAGQCQCASYFSFPLAHGKGSGYKSRVAEESDRGQNEVAVVQGCAVKGGGGGQRDEAAGVGGLPRGQSRGGRVGATNPKQLTSKGGLTQALHEM